MGCGRFLGIFVTLAGSLLFWMAFAGDFDFSDAPPGFPMPGAILLIAAGVSLFLFFGYRDRKAKEAAEAAAKRAAERSSGGGYSGGYDYDDYDDDGPSDYERAMYERDDDDGGPSALKGFLDDLGDDLFPF